MHQSILTYKSTKKINAIDPAGETLKLTCYYSADPLTAFISLSILPDSEQLFPARAQNEAATCFPPRQWIQCPGIVLF